MVRKGTARDVDDEPASCDTQTAHSFPESCLSAAGGKQGGRRTGGYGLCTRDATRLVYCGSKKRLKGGKEGLKTVLMPLLVTGLGVALVWFN